MSSTPGKLSQGLGQGVKIRPSLCFYNPEEVFRALQTNQTVIKWLQFIGDKYVPPEKDVILIYPCSAVKPYYRSPSYRRLLTILEEGNLRERVHLLTISEPFGLVPEEFYYDGFSWYDCPGLFKWWCVKHGQPFDLGLLEKSLDLIASYIATFLLRITNRWSRFQIVGFVRTMTSSFENRADHTHYRMLTKASNMAGVKIEILPGKSLVKRIVRQRGRLAWDYYGVSHPVALKHLTKRLYTLLGSSATRSN